MLNRRTFTLLELMTVVAVLAALAALAIPQFYDMQLRSKASEITTNLDGIRTAEVAYEAGHDDYVYTNGDGYWPDASPGKSQRIWTSGSGFDDLEWSPDGQVYGSYMVTSAGGLRVTALSNVDADSYVAEWRADLDEAPGFHQCFPAAPECL